LNQTIAQEEVQKPEISRKGKWKFWVANMLTLPNWFLGAEFVALIQPSSQWRLIHLVKPKPPPLKIGREATVMIRMNNNWKKRELVQLE
jgi:hypothetical protein